MFKWFWTIFSLGAPGVTEWVPTICSKTVISINNITESSLTEQSACAKIQQYTVLTLARAAQLRRYCLSMLRRWRIQNLRADLTLAFGGTHKELIAQFKQETKLSVTKDKPEYFCVLYLVTSYNFCVFLPRQSWFILPNPRTTDETVKAIRRLGAKESFVA